MRGKNILWIPLIAMLFGAMMVGVGSAPKIEVAPAKLYIDPSRWPAAGTLGHPGDVFTIAVKVDKVEDLWSAGFTIKFAPYSAILMASEVTEGDFLKQGGYYTFFAKTINAFKGTVKIGMTRLFTPGLPNVGASGTGTLATMKFTVLEAGESPLEIVEEALIDSSGNPIGYEIWNSFYYGATANLIRMELASGRRVKVCETQYFKSKAINKGDVPLIVRTRFDIERLEDGRRLKMYSGQRYLRGWFGEAPIEYLYVNGFTGHYGAGWGWEYVGESPYLNAVGDGNYIYCDIPEDTYIGDLELPGYYPYTGRYDFEDFALGPDDVIENIWLEMYTYAQFHDKGGGRHLDFDTYMRKADQSAPSYWVGSGWGMMDWGWHGLLHETDPVSALIPGITTQSGLNAARVRFILYWVEDDYGAGWAAIDAMRLRVEFAAVDPVDPPEWEIGPYPAELELDPMIMKARSDLVGTYVVTATLEYTLAGWSWIQGDKTQTRTWEIVP